MSPTDPYLLADRLQDLTPPQQIAANPLIDRTITLYGYLRGINLPSSGSRVHIPGAGDLTITSVEKLKDPCPLPTADGEKRRRMGEKGKLIHAPMSDVGGVMYDKDAVYVNVLGSFTRRKEGEEFGEDGKRLGTFSPACSSRRIRCSKHKHADSPFLSSLSHLSQLRKARESAW